MNLSTKILSDIIVHMKYAKYLPEKQRRETWEEIVDRNKDMHILNYPNLKDEIEMAYKMVYDKKILPSMRSMQFAGKAIEVTPNRIYNCSYLPMDDWKSFSEVCFLLLSGVGVGISIQTQHINKLPQINLPDTTRNRRFLIGDSIEGWADAIKILIKSYINGTQSIKFDYSDIRKKGAQLITSGGKAPGPVPLKNCLTAIENILSQKNTGDKLSSIEVYDIVCHIADAVLAGGIRRAAIITLFSKDDYDMLTAKTDNWWELNPQRGRSNNSIVLDRNNIDRDEFDAILKKIELSHAGEPGIYFTNNIEIGTNPCCISKDTLIDTDKGQYKITDICNRFNNGSSINVLSLNINTNQLEYKPIIWGDLTGLDFPLIHIKLESGEELKCTPDHKILIKNFASDNTNEHQYYYIQAQDLKIDEHKVVTDIDSVSNIIELYYDEVGNVYDITVKDNHNFFANGILVHNCEISLQPNSFCNLCDINTSNLESQEDFNDRCKSASIIGTLQAGYTNFHYLRSNWSKTTEKESLIGIGLTGLASRRILDINLQEGANIIKDINIDISNKMNINSSKRLTCVKPSGTSSLVLGCSSGIHSWYSDYYIRRIRVNKNEAIYTYLSINNPELLEDDFFNPIHTSIIKIPQKAPAGAILKENETAIELLERIKYIHQNWIQPGHISGDNTNNVSATITLNQYEWHDVGNWLWDNKEYYNGISILPDSNHTYIQMPYEKCTEEEYNNLYNSLKDIDLSNVIELQDDTNLQGEVACTGGTCEII